jgi:hypothetical protein
MTIRALLLPAIVLLAACSETPVEDMGEEAIAAHEQQIEEDALSLEQAADKAVKALEEDIDAELNAEGIGAPAAVPAPANTEN